MQNTVESEKKTSEHDFTAEPAQIDAGEITRILRRWTEGDATALAKLVDALYPELKRLAEYRMHGELSDHTLQPTALVNELYIQLSKAQSCTWTNRQHFLVAAWRAVRRLLVDHAPARNSLRRGRAFHLIPLTENSLGSRESPDSTLIIEEVLGKLASEEPRMAHVFEMRYFGGLTFAEIASILDVIERTAKRDDEFASIWISSQLRKSGSDVGRRMGSH
ncbi:MAG: ECF-type sigma factor [Bryobacteraceae bacterium]